MIPEAGGSFNSGGWEEDGAAGNRDSTTKRSAPHPSSLPRWGRGDRDRVSGDRGGQRGRLESHLTTLNSL